MQFSQNKYQAPQERFVSLTYLVFHQSHSNADQIITSSGNGAIGDSAGLYFILIQLHFIAEETKQLDKKVLITMANV